MKRDADRELKGRIVRELQRIGRPATAQELGYTGFCQPYRASAIERVLAELAEYGFLAVDERTENRNPGSPTCRTRVARRYYSLPGGAP